MTNAISIAQYGSSNPTFRNRIINGGMTIDQRNSGASGTATNNSYMIDRYVWYGTQASKATFQQNSGSVTTPAGFQNYLGFVSSSAYSILSTDYFVVEQPIEGFNVADLGFGTANAKTVTLSFWVYSSLTGTFGGSLQNSAQNRSYPFSYTISSTNTWTQINLPIAGDTTGTWVTNNGVGIRVNFSLGAGSSESGTAGSWAGSNYWSATGAVSVVGTNGATFYITGVQLEAGSTATPFEYRQYGTELALCQRYYQGNLTNGGSGTSTGNAIFRGNNSSATGTFFYWMPFSVLMRAAPTMGVGIPTYSNANSAVFYNAAQGGAEISLNVISAGGYAVLPWSASSEL